MDPLRRRPNLIRDFPVPVFAGPLITGRILGLFRKLKFLNPSPRIVGIEEGLCSQHHFHRKRFERCRRRIRRCQTPDVCGDGIE